MVSAVLRFVLHTTGGFKAVREIESQLRPNQQTLLNRTTWRDKEPRSCAVTSVQARPHAVAESQPVSIHIEVTYHPPGTVWYFGTTKYNGWKVMVLNRDRDGRLLDHRGQPLKDGDQPVEIAHDIYRDADFHELNFGEFLEEVPLQPFAIVAAEEAINRITANRSWETLGNSGFMAPHRTRPLKKIVISSAPSGCQVDGLGTHVVNLPSASPHLEHLLIQRLFDLLVEFQQGKISLHNYGTPEMTFVEFSDSLVHCQGNDHGFRHWRDVLHWYTHRTFLEELALRLHALFAIDVAIVEGATEGLLLQAARPGPRRLPGQ